VLLVGNGLSINVWGNFDYPSLLAEAKARKLLSAADAKLFESLAATNFEQVLHPLTDAIRVADALGQDHAAQSAHRDSVQKALVDAVHSVHIAKAEIPADTLDRIKKEMRLYRHVFTTSYDLILYWALMHDERCRGFLDFFWSGFFDESTHRFTDADDRTRLYFLHGALHLVVLSDGRAHKRKANWLTLLDQFGTFYKGDLGTQPLIVTEAQAADKRHRIIENDYLTFCWRELERCPSPVVLFGHRLGDQDAHLVQALNAQPRRPVAVSLRDKGRRQNGKEKHRIASMLDCEAELHFFDAESHPLGAADIRMKETPWRKLLRAATPKAA